MLMVGPEWQWQGPWWNGDVWGFPARGVISTGEAELSFAPVDVPQSGSSLSLELGECGDRGAALRAILEALGGLGVDVRGVRWE